MTRRTADPAAPALASASKEIMMNYQDWTALLIVLLPALIAWFLFGVEVAATRFRYEMKRRAFA
jgi:hypothetical protein